MKLDKTLEAISKNDYLTITNKERKILYKGFNKDLFGLDTQKYDVIWAKSYFNQALGDYAWNVIVESILKEE